MLGDEVAGEGEGEGWFWEEMQVERGFDGDCGRGLGGRVC